MPRTGLRERFSHLSCRKAAGALAIAALCLAAQPGFAGTPLIQGQFYGQAASVEAEALVGPLSIGLANSAAVACPCNGTGGGVVTDTVSNVSIGTSGSLISAGTTTASAQAGKTSSYASTTQISTISKLNVLGGLITADAITAWARSSATPTKLGLSYELSSFVNLVIAGQPIDPKVAANTAIKVAGLGTVTLKFVNQGTYGTQSNAIEVEMLRIQVDATNTLGLPANAVIIVGEAFAGYNRVQPAAAVSGFSETLAVTAEAGALLQEAASGGALTGIPSCDGTGGATLTDSVASVSASGLLSLGASTVTAFGGLSGSATVSKTTSSIANVSLLGGLITATGINAVASESRTGTVSTPSTVGSTFGGLYVAGVEIAGPVAPNTVISLPAIGYVVLNEQPAASNNVVQVNGLHIVVTLGNTLGLPIGAQIFVAHAQAGVSAF